MNNLEFANDVTLLDADLAFRRVGEQWDLVANRASTSRERAQ